MKAVLQNQPDVLASILLLDCKLSRLLELPQTLQAKGYQCFFCDEIKQVLSYLSLRSFDLLIISQSEGVCKDIQLIRDSNEGYLPVLMICDELSDEQLEDFTSAEIDAVIFTPINLTFLLLKISASLRLKQLFQREIQQKQQLLQYWQNVDQEQEIAAKVFANILKSGFLETEAVKAVISPMTLFNGDLVLVSRTPENHLHVLLGDFTGHGLAASIAATPTAEIFSGMTQKGFAINDIVLEINKKLKKMLPVNMFLAVTVVALKPDEKKICMITCGLPEHFLVDHQAKTCVTINSSNLPLGIESEIAITEQVFKLNGGECLFLFTDGMFEAENDKGEAFGAQRIINAICTEDVNDMEYLQNSLTIHRGQSHQKDDIAFVKLICYVENVPWRNTGSAQMKKHVEPLICRSMMEFDMSTLRVLNPVPLIVNALMDIQSLHSYRQTIFIIINELFVNALDHGLLELDSSIKSTPDGFMAFYALKEQRLHSCCHKGYIRFVFKHEVSEMGGRLIIKVRDTGKGFDQRNLQNHSQTNMAYCGRGIKLVTALCTSLSFQGNGNRVTVVFDWQS